MTKSEIASEARHRMLTQPGHLYAAFSKGECWIKLGFSLDVDRRLGEINRRFPQLAPFSLIGKTPSLYRAERQMHVALGRFRDYQIGLSRELYLALPEVQKIVRTVVSGADRPPLDLDQFFDFIRWTSQLVRPRREEIRHWYRVARQTNYRELP